MRKYRITVDEHDRWSGSEQWFEYYDTRKEAQKRIDEMQKQFGGKKVTPEYYCFGYDLVPVERVEETITVDKIIKE